MSEYPCEVNVQGVLVRYPDAESAGVVDGDAAGALAGASNGGGRR